MENYLLKLTPDARNMDSEGSLDTSVLNGKSIQRTMNILDVTDSSGNRKVVGVLRDGQTFDNVVSGVNMEVEDSDE
jgi:hypothetical protein